MGNWGQHVVDLPSIYVPVDAEVFACGSDTEHAIKGKPPWPQKRMENDTFGVFLITILVPAGAGFSGPGRITLGAHFGWGSAVGPRLIMPDFMLEFLAC